MTPSDARAHRLPLQTRGRAEQGRDASVFSPVTTSPTVYLLGIAAAEILMVTNPRLGLPVHIVMLFATLVEGGRTNDVGRRGLLWSLSLMPVMRILGIAPPLGALPRLYWFAAIGIPVLIATLIAARAIGFSRRDIGLTTRLINLPLDLLLLALGCGLGMVEYALLVPQPLAGALTFDETWWPALILIVVTGFGEELLFRGLLLTAALRALGIWSGLLYTTVVFTVMQIGTMNPVQVALALLAGLVYGLVTIRTGSILAAALSHAAVNVTMYLVWPTMLPDIVGRW